MPGLKWKVLLVQPVPVPLGLVLVARRSLRDIDGHVRAGSELILELLSQPREAQRTALLRDGFIQRPSDYGDAPYVVTRRLIEEGRAHLVLRSLGLEVFAT
jgi:hypothetical protein